MTLGQEMRQGLFYKLRSSCLCYPVIISRPCSRDAGCVWDRCDRVLRRWLVAASVGSSRGLQWYDTRPSHPSTFTHTHTRLSVSQSMLICQHVLTPTQSTVSGEMTNSQLAISTQVNLSTNCEYSAIHSLVLWISPQFDCISAIADQTHNIYFTNNFVLNTVNKFLYHHH